MKSSTHKWQEQFETVSKEWKYVTEFRKNEIKSFISALLLSQLREVQEMTEKIRKENCYSGMPNKHPCDSVCEAIQDITLALEEKIKELK